MSKIGDLFVKLGLKKDEFSRGLNEAGKESEGFVSKLKGIGTKAAAVWAAIGVGAVALADKFAHTSQRFGDLWDQTMAGMRGAWDQFTTALTNFDFAGLGQRIKNAFDAARQSAAAHDAEFEVTNSINLRKAEMREELAILQQRMRNQNLSNEERLKAQKEYLAKMQPLYDQEAAMRKDIMLADTEEYLTNAKVAVNATNREALRTFLTDVAPNGQLLEALDAYTKRNQGKRRTKFTAEQERLVDQFLERYDANTGATIAALATYYQGTNDKTAKKVVDALEGYYSATGAFADETRRVQQLGDSILNSSRSAAAKEKKSPLADIEKAMAEGNRKVEERIRQRQAMLKEVQDAMEEDFADFENRFGADMERLAQQMVAPFEEVNERALQLGEEFHDAIIEGYSEGIQTLTDQLFGLEEMNPGAVLQALLTPFADLAINEGKILVAAGLGIEAIKDALSSLNGVAAIAAGATLITIGSAVKSGLAALAKAGGSAGYASTYTGTASGNGTQNIATEMTIYVEGRISGRDIVLSGQKTVNQWNR